MQTFVRSGAPVATTTPLEFSLFRPYLDLGPALPNPPIHVLAVELAYRNLSAGFANRPTIQSRPGPSFRDRFMGSAAWARNYRVRRPSELRPQLRTARWQNLVDLLDGFAGADIETQHGVSTLLCSLGMYSAVLDLADQLADRQPLLLGVRAQLAHARATTTRTKVAQVASVQAVEAIVDCTELPAAARMKACTTLVVLHSRGPMAAPERAVRFSRLAAGFAEQLRPDSSWLDQLALSTYWRATSFEPYLTGDRAETWRRLDLAEQCARAVPDATVEQSMARRLNLHPLLETLSVTATAFGDLPLAVRYCTEFAELDAMDGKTHLRLGDLLVRSGEFEAATRSFLRAAALGAPFAALAWCRVAANTSDPALRRLALTSAQLADPAAVTPLVETIRQARRDGDHEWEQRAERALAVLGSGVRAGQVSP